MQPQVRRMLKKARMGRHPVMGSFAVIALGAAMLVMATPGSGSPALTAAPIAVFAPCGPTAGPGARCGTVAVPLDRVRPSAGTIAIAFQFYPATDTSQPAVSTIVSSSGGPGISNLSDVRLWRAKLQPLLSRFNFLAIDHRGIGASAAINCPALQHVRGNQVTAARKCGAQLGTTAYRYGSGDVADDVDAVRQALHVDKIDYYGSSYGPVDVRAYAFRHPDHLRSAVLDSPYGSRDAAFSRTLPTAMARIARLVCRRSPSCAASNPAPRATLTWLVRRVRRDPVRGSGHDADGKAHRLIVDEKALLGILYNDYFSDPAFLNQGEIFAAARALRDGDTVPLLRLAAESPAPTDFGDPTGNTSVGADYAVFCADSNFPWDKNAPEATREAQYQAALNALPDNASAPFSITTWARFIASQPVLLVPGGDACVPWPKPTRPEPPFPVNQPFPANIPALLLGGGLDYLDINAERSLMPLFPSGTFVDVESAGHITTFWNPCAQAIALHFLATLQTGDTSCAANPLGAMGNPFGSATGKLQLQGAGKFPTRANDAVPAREDPGRDLDTSRLDAQVANVAWLTVVDAVYRLPRMTGNTGRGLRGGSYAVTKSTAATTITYRRAQFTDDVQISGRATLDSDNRLEATVTVKGPDGENGTLTIDATLWDPAQPTAALRGQLRHHDIAFTTQTR
jgi:pimeloyl-ACP methyl ester carboxylesterase